MEIVINGEQKQTDLVVLNEILESAGFDIERVAVLINGEIVKRKTFKEHRVIAGDKIEVVSFVGGG